MDDQQTRIAESMRLGLSAEWGEKRVGQCWRQMRLSLRHAGIEKEDLPPQGSDAAQAFEWFKTHGRVRPTLTNSLPGDLIFWVGSGHGKHGHVGGRIAGNRLAENSSYHSGPNDDDARGTRDLRQLFGISGVVRLAPVNEGGGA